MTKQVVTLEKMIEFVASKDPNEEYQYVDSENCPIAQYLKSLGYKNVSVAPSFWIARPNGGTRIQGDVPGKISDALNNWPDETFGAALERLKEVRDEQAS